MAPVPMFSTPTPPVGATFAAPSPAGTPQPPTYDPTLAQMFSAPPVSAYPYAYAYGAPVAAAPAPRSNVRMIVAISLVFVLALATGIMSTLFVVQKHQTSKANDTINSLSSQVNGLNSSNQDLQRKLDQAKNDTDQSNQARQALADCLNAIEALLGAESASNGQITPEIQSLGADADTKCRKAAAYQ